MPDATLSARFRTLTPAQVHIPSSSLRIRPHLAMGKKFDTVQLGLRLAKEVAEDIPAPGLKSALGLASALAGMYDTMRGNKDDLPDLEDRLRALTEINDTSGCNLALKGRLTVLQANLKPLLDKCRTLRQYHEEHKFRTFLFSFLIEKTIREMEKKISMQLEDFTMSGGIAINDLVTEMKAQLDIIQEQNKEILAQGAYASVVESPTHLHSRRTHSRRSTADGLAEFLWNCRCV
ncbi:hypothetical protein GGX14DRAFT_210528 [Mycena pura]|uniref:Uncharacterized protein n=1 Tax=Mycena pura TaxID=153505 RepID=A0AAD6Y366_9AGAR|nr:hypothetical protein GGX14DRAFT_210528 [Mycena pura]